MPAELTYIAISDEFPGGQRQPHIEDEIKSRSYTSPQEIVQEIRQHGFHMGEGLPPFVYANGKTHQVFQLYRKPHVEVGHIVISTWD